MLFNNNANSNTSTNTTNSQNSSIESKYANANWKELSPSSSTNVDSNIARVNVSLGHN